MCNNCNCDNYDKCSIVGYMPVGFCCSKCYLYDEARTCLRGKSVLTVEVEASEEESGIHPVSSEVENGMVKVVIEEKGKKIPIFIDIKKQLEDKD